MLKLTNITIVFGATMSIQTKVKEAKTQTLNKPTIEEVKKYLAKWEALEDYKAQEEALNKLFKTLPNNIELQDIMIKSATLNDFYSTNIFKIYLVANNIYKNIKNIDEKLKSGKIELVNEITEINKEKLNREFYSFVTKYCSHHNPEKFPIYDSYVCKILVLLNKQEENEKWKFADFKKDDLKNYQKFAEVLSLFQRRFGLEEFSLKELDRYLWLLGKETFPRKQKANKNKEQNESGHKP